MVKLGSLALAAERVDLSQSAGTASFRRYISSTCPTLIRLNYRTLPKGPYVSGHACLFTFFPLSGHACHFHRLSTVTLIIPFHFETNKISYLFNFKFNFLFFENLFYKPTISQLLLFFLLTEKTKLRAQENSNKTPKIKFKKKK